MRANACLAWAYSESALFVVLTPGKPPDAEWNEFMSDLRARKGVTGIVVLPNEGKLSPTQRADLQRWFEANDAARAAVVSDSVMVRGIVKALNWFGVDVKAFSPEQMDAAFAYAQLPEARWADARVILRGLKVQLDQLSSRAS